MGQVVDRSQGYAFSTDTSLQLTVGGLLDGSNTVGREVSYQYGLYNYYTPGFEPIRSVTLSNYGPNTVHNVALVFNKRGAWQTLPSIVGEVFSPADDPKTAALKLWGFVERNHQYFYSPEPFPAAEIQDPVKFLTSYGYGNCFMIANAVKYINTTHTKDSLWIWGLNSGQHASAEVKVGNRYAILDADEGGFYLRLDNETLASYDDIVYDPYLYLRTQHFGPGSPYSSSENYSNLYQTYLSGANYRSGFFEYGNSGINASFSLMPGESFSYVTPDTGTVAPYHQLITAGYGQYPTLGDVGSVIRVGIFKYSPDFINGNSGQLAYQYTNMQIEGGFNSTVPLVHPITATGGNMIFNMVSPFVMTGAKLVGSFYASTPADTISIQYSPDLVNWTTVWQSHQTGHFTDSVSLDGVIAPLVNTATYGYYLRYNFQSGSSNTGCGLDSLTITDSCQVSRFFAPALRTGVNNIAVSTSDGVQTGRSLNLDLEWQENSSNQPPNPVVNPLFPADGSNPDSTMFTFSWQPATDADGDGIKDYFFQLSDDSTMSHPLATNFMRYMSAIGPVSNSFRPERPDFLNDGTTYYWRVRALDNRGAWGPWGKVWRFTPHAPRTPVNFRYLLVDSAHVQVRWDPNPQGNTPVQYILYTDTVRGSFPTPVIGTALTDTSVIMGLNRMMYVRIAAVDQNGVQSPPSPYITLWPPVRMQYGSVGLTSILPSVSNNGYTLRYTPYDTGFFQVSGQNLVAKSTGVSYVNALFVNSIDSVIAQEEVPVIVGKAPLQVIAADVSKIYGDTLTPLHFQFIGFVNGDDSSVLDQLPVLTTAVTQYSPVGTYPISVSGGADNNYTLSYQSGHYFVDSALLTVTAQNDTIHFLDPLPVPAYSVNGWRSNDSVAGFDVPPVATIEAPSQPTSGTYDISVGGGAAKNYSIAYNNGNLLVRSTGPKVSLSINGDYPDSSYTYMLRIDSTGGTTDKIRIILRDVNSPLLLKPLDLEYSGLTDGTVFSGVLDGIITGRNYRAYATIQNNVGRDTSQVYNIFTDVDAPFVLYPNPASTLLRVDLGIVADNPMKMVIYSMKGQEVYRNEQLTGASFDIDVSNLPAGTYVVGLVRKNKVITRKITIIH